MSLPAFQLTGDALRGVHTDGPEYAAAVAALPQEVRLGCAVRRGVRTAPAFTKYYDAGLAAVPPPASTNYRAKAALAIARMYLNDRKGTCTVADRYHCVGVHTGNDAGAPLVGTDAEVESVYEIWNPPPRDDGCVITDVLNHHRDRGIPVGGVTHKIDGYVSLDWTNKLQVKVATYLFPGIPLGIDFPQEWLSKAVWDVTDSPVVGGHDVPIIDYDDSGVYVPSWGRVYLMTWAALQSRRWVGEAHVVLSPDWYGSDKVAPCGVDAATLKADLDVIKGGGTPPVDPTPPPVPPPTPAPPPGPAPTGKVHIGVSAFVDFPSGQPGTVGTVAGTAKVLTALGEDDLREAAGLFGLTVPPEVWALLGKYGPLILNVLIPDLFLVYKHLKTWAEVIADVEAAVLNGRTFQWGFSI